MTDSERIRTGIALSLFLHFMLLSTSWREDSPRADFSTTVQLDMESAAISPTSRSGLDVEAPSRGEAQEQAFDDIGGHEHDFPIDTPDSHR